MSNDALILTGVVLTGLVLGALLMRRRALGGVPAVDAVTAAPTGTAPPSYRSKLRRPRCTGQNSSVVPVEIAPADVALPEPDRGGVPLPEIRVAARLEAGETTIEFTALRPMKRRSNAPGNCMNKGIRLHTPIVVSSDDVEKALLEQAKNEPAVLRACEYLRGEAAERAAHELNQALDINAFELLTQGWARVPAVRNAAQLSALKPGPPSIVWLDEHNIASTSYPVLQIHVAQDALPELRLRLEIIAGVQSATLAARAGRIELVALGKVSVIARLRYKDVLLKEHTTTVEGALRDPFKHQRAARDSPSGVDIYI